MPVLIRNPVIHLFLRRESIAFALFTCPCDMCPYAVPYAVVLYRIKVVMQELCGFGSNAGGVLEFIETGLAKSAD